MKIEKQTVYLLVKVEDELPESGSWVICDKSEELLYSHNYGWMYNASTIIPKDKQPTFWFKPKEGYFFTPEQINEYIQIIIEQALKTASENAELKVKLKFKCSTEDLEKGFTSGQLAVIIDKESIIDTFKETFEKFKYDETGDIFRD